MILLDIIFLFATLFIITIINRLNIYDFMIILEIT